MLKESIDLSELALFFVMNVTGQSLAYYTVTGTATNVVTSGTIQLAIHEQTKDGEPFPEEGVEVKAGQVRISTCPLISCRTCVLVSHF